jgi:hypothetical protein
MVGVRGCCVGVFENEEREVDAVVAAAVAAAVAEEEEEEDVIKRDRPRDGGAC